MKSAIFQSQDEYVCRTPKRPIKKKGYAIKVNIEEETYFYKVLNEVIPLKAILVQLSVLTPRGVCEDGALRCR
jgi:hypothetical protein